MILQGRLLLDPAAPPCPGWIDVRDGRIERVGEGAPTTTADVGHPDAIITAGFVDAHLHLPQFTAIGCDGLDLLDWLDAVIYPVEMRWAARDAADAGVDLAYRRLLRAGTLGYAGYLTSHPHGLDAVCRQHARIPLRGLVGQTLMDREGPAALCDQPVADLPTPPDDRLAFSVNPRFAVSCTSELLARCGERAAAGVPVQTHLGEQTREAAAVRDLFPDASHYTAVYDAAGLLTERALLAHAVHLSREEWILIAERDSVVVHCPGANTFLRSGLFDLEAAREHGVRVALGSDVAAGPDVAMPRVARAMIEIAKIRASIAPTAVHVPTPAEAWHLITAGNAETLGLADAGRLTAGASADLLVLQPPFPIDEDLVGRLLYTWEDDYIATRILAGEVVDAHASR